MHNLFDCPIEGQSRENAAFHSKSNGVQPPCSYWLLLDNGKGTGQLFIVGQLVE